MQEVPLETKQSEILGNEIMAQTTRPELAQYLHAALFIPTTSSLLKAIKQGFLKTWTGLIEGIIKKHPQKLSNRAMGHLHIRIQGIQ